MKPPLFPIDQPVMPEQRQIGRAATISALETRLAAVSHQWLIGPRRIGKTSVAKAVLARLRTGGSLALDIDLSRHGALTEASLAGDIARQAQAAQAGSLGMRVTSVAGRVRRKAQSSANLGDALDALGFESQAEALAAVSALLAGADDGGPGLERVLASIALHARAVDRHAYLLLDEVQLLAQVADADSRVARWCREPDSPIVFVFAGSEESAVRKLREPGSPLAAIGQEFTLAEIGDEDWIAGLGQRFEEAGIEIDRDRLGQIIFASERHPRRTMLIAANVNNHHMQQPGALSIETIVELAIRDAERDRAWN